MVTDLICDTFLPSGGRSQIVLCSVVQRPLRASALYQLTRYGPWLCEAEFCLPEHKQTLTQWVDGKEKDRKNIENYHQPVTMEN